MGFAYAPKVVRDYLAINLTGVRVVSDVPKTKPAKLVTVTSAPVGTSRDSKYLSWRRLIIHAAVKSGDAETDSAKLAEDCRDLIQAAKYKGLGIRRVNVTGEPARLDDPDDNSVRFVMTVDVLMRSL